jgi:hypothetical protein
MKHTTDYQGCQSLNEKLPDQPNIIIITAEGIIQRAKVSKFEENIAQYKKIQPQNITTIREVKM